MANWMATRHPTRAAASSGAAHTNPARPTFLPEAASPRTTLAAVAHDPTSTPAAALTPAPIRARVPAPASARCLRKGRAELGPSAWGSCRQKNRRANEHSEPSPGGSDRHPILVEPGGHTTAVEANDRNGRCDSDGCSDERSRNSTRSNDGPRMPRCEPRSEERLRITHGGMSQSERCAIRHGEERHEQRQRQASKRIEQDHPRPRAVWREFLRSMWPGVGCRTAPGPRAALHHLRPLSVLRWAPARTVDDQSQPRRGRCVDRGRRSRRRSAQLRADREST
jgi:hypothetical protein